MTPLIAWFLWIGLIVLLILVVVDIVATATAVKIIRHIEWYEEVDHQQQPPQAKS